MKALSIRQPWIELILQRKKTLEIRSWKTDHRGEIFLHSAFNFDRAALKRYPMPKPQTSAIVGTVNIDDVEELNERRWRELAGVISRIGLGIRIDAVMDSGCRELGGSRSRGRVSGDRFCGRRKDENR